MRLWKLRPHLLSTCDGRIVVPLPISYTPFRRQAPGLSLRVLGSIELDWLGLRLLYYMLSNLVRSGGVAIHS
jgi:hypothetical protein